MVTQLRSEAQKLKDSNSNLQEKIKELKVRFHLFVATCLSVSDYVGKYVIPTLVLCIIQYDYFLARVHGLTHNNVCRLRRMSFVMKSKG